MNGIDPAPELPGWTHLYSGKVRELYVPAGNATAGNVPAGNVPAEIVPAEIVPAADRVLVVATDRISAFDHILSSTIPDKGRVLTQLSLWWFEQLDDVANHVISTDVPAAVSGRAMICRKLDMYPVECIARGYLTGSGLLEYRDRGTVCGLALPDGLVDGSRLESPIFTPSAKAEVGDHDENIDFAAVSDAVGTATAARLRDLTLAIYSRAEAVARDRGIILADTKVEFGLDPDAGRIVLADEVLTPDSSRFWDAAGWQPGRARPSFDKQYVRDWLLSADAGWDKASDTPPPPLPDDVIERTRDRYLQAYERLTGRVFS